LRISQERSAVSFDDDVARAVLRYMGVVGVSFARERPEWGTKAWYCHLRKIVYAPVTFVIGPERIMRWIPVLNRCDAPSDAKEDLGLLLGTDAWS
jgi:hypothetical protein